MGYYNSYSSRDALSSNVFRYSENNVDSNGKKHKESYNSLSSLCHAWASGNVPRGRSGSSMFFENGIIYSYGYHYKASFIHTDGNENTLVLINSNGYSNSTRNHLSEIRRAVKHLDILSVPNVTPENDHDENLEYLNEQISICLENIFKRKGYSTDESLIQLVDDFNQYCAFFDINESIELSDEFLVLMRELVTERQERKVIRDTKHKANEELKLEKLREENKIELERLEREFPSYLEAWERGELTDNELNHKSYTVKYIPAHFGHTKRVGLSIKLDQYKERIETKLKEQYADNIKAFKNGEINYITSYFYIGNIELDLSNDYSFLRVRDKKVETSNRADVPLDHAVRLLKMILKNEAKSGERVGLFTLSKIDDEPKGDRTISIGCHKILLSEAIETLKPYMNETKLELVK